MRDTLAVFYLNLKKKTFRFSLFLFILFWWDMLLLMPSSRYRENLSYWLTFGVSAVIQLLKLWPTWQIPVWVSSQWHWGHFSCWSELITLWISLWVSSMSTNTMAFHHIVIFFQEIVSELKPWNGDWVRFRSFVIWFMLLSSFMSAEKSKWEN